LGTNTKSTNLRIHKLVIFNQATKIDAHEEKHFHSNLYYMTLNFMVFSGYFDLLHQQNWPPWYNWILLKVT
jgi:hypothetical protein